MKKTDDIDLLLILQPHAPSPPRLQRGGITQNTLSFLSVNLNPKTQLRLPSVGLDRTMHCPSSTTHRQTVECNSKVFS